MADELNPDDAELFNLLEMYALLMTRESEYEISVLLPQSVLRRFPELPGMLRCLASLDALTDEAESNPGTQFHGGIVSRPESSFRAPRQIGPYRLISELGRGGMGVVYLAEHVSLSARVAIKMIRSSEWASSDEIHRFYREAKAAARLQHPYIVRVYDVGEQEGLHYLVMEYVAGGTLGDLLKEACPPVETAVRLLLKVTQAVEYLHQQGILHRDLKPANILLDAAGEPHVTDFGLAKVFDHDDGKTATGMIIGTPAYMAPEQAWGESHSACVQSDIYSLGAIFYELLVGRPPFGDSGPLDILLRLRDAEPLPPRKVKLSVPRALEQICLRCLEKQPANRYESAAQLAGDLERFLNREPIHLPALDAFTQIIRWVRREPPLVSRLVGFAVMAAIVSYAELVAKSSRPPFVPVMVVLGLWSAGSLILQKLLNRELSTGVVRTIWVLLDCVLFTAAISFAEGRVESLLVGYSLLIVASAWWYQPRLVWMMTGTSMIAYLVLDQYRGDPEIPGHYPLIVLGELGVVGGIVASLVHQIRDLLHRRTQPVK